MSFTPIAIEGRFMSPDGTPSVGTISARLSTRLRNTADGTLLDVVEISGSLDAAGRVVGPNGLALVLDATDDVTTEPVGAYYTFSLTLETSSVLEFSSPVPHDPITWAGAESGLCVDSAAVTTAASDLVTLTNLVVASSMIGATVTGTNITGSLTITAVNVLTNTLTLSGTANSSGVDATFTIHGGCIGLTALIGNAL